jgi:hypothetical protein
LRSSADIAVIIGSPLAVGHLVVGHVAFGHRQEHLFEAAFHAVQLADLHSRQYQRLVDSRGVLRPGGAAHLISVPLHPLRAEQLTRDAGGGIDRPGGQPQRCRTAKVVHGAVGDQPAPGDHSDPVADLLDLGEQVAGQQHAARPGAQLPDQRAHVGHPRGIEPVGRLVENQQLRFLEQRCGDAEPLLHPQ